MGDPPVDLGIEGITDAVVVGRGGFGVVYRASQPAFGRTVAVKVITGVDLDAEARMRFERECRAMGALSGHPHIVTVYGNGWLPDGRPYLVMEFLPGGSLAERLRTGGPMGWDEATSVVIRVAGALETAHRSGVLHRDIKPENILMSAYEEPKLGDFGIARLEGAVATRSGLMTASPLHVAPEILEGEPPSPRSDTYGLASTLYALLAGRAAFARDGEESILPIFHRVLTTDPPDLRPAGVPGPVWDVVAQGMAKNPAERFATPEALARALADCRIRLGAAPVRHVVRHSGRLAQAGGEPRAATATVTPPPTAPPTVPGVVTPPPGPPPPAPPGAGTGPEATPPAPSVPPPAPVPPPGAVTPPPGPPPAGGGGPEIPPPGSATPPPRGGPASETVTSRPWPLVVGGALVVLLALAVVGVLVSRDGGTTTPTTVPDAPVDPAGALLTAGDLGDGWEPTRPLAGSQRLIDPCNRAVDLPAGALVAEESAAFTDGAGQTYEHYVAVYRSTGDVAAYLDGILTNLDTCGGTWTDPSGQTHTMEVVPAPGIGDRRLALVDTIATTSGVQASLRAIVTSRREVVSLLLYVAVTPDETQLDRIVSVVGERLIEVVG